MKKNTKKTNLRIGQFWSCGNWGTVQLTKIHRNVANPYIVGEVTKAGSYTDKYDKVTLFVKSFEDGTYTPLPAAR